MNRDTVSRFSRVLSTISTTMEYKEIQIILIHNLSLETSTAQESINKAKICAAVHLIYKNAVFGVNAVLLYYNNPQKLCIQQQAEDIKLHQRQITFC